MIFHGVLLTCVMDPHVVKPLGAYAIANELRKQGYNILVINHFNNFTIDKIKKLLEKAISKDTLFLGYSSSLFSQEGLLNFLPIDQEDFAGLNQYAKSLHPELKVLFGGANSKRITSFNLKHRNNLGVDFAFHGNAEEKIVTFVSNLVNNIPQQISNTYNGLSEISYDIKGLNFNIKEYLHTWHEHDFVLPNESLSLEVARGCIFKCKFCSFPNIGKHPNDDSYIRQEENILTELLTNYEKFGTLTYSITDDTFNERTSKIEMMLRVRDRSKLDLNFVGYNRLDLIAKKPEQLPLLVDLNFNGHFFGIESLHYPSAKIIGKGIRPEEVKETLYRIRDAYRNQVSISAGFIIGLPHETPETLNNWFQWLLPKDNPIDFVKLFPLNLRPSNAIVESDFFSTPEKFGYELLADGAWQNSVWDYDACKTICDNYNKLLFASGRNKIGTFSAASMTIHGQSFIDLAKTSVKDLPVSEIRVKNLPLFEDYYNRIYNYLTSN